MDYQCPSCDQMVRVGTHCPRCSAKHKPRKSNKKPVERKSWEQDASADGLDLPDDDFDYDDFVQREFGRSPHRSIGIAWYWYAVAVFLLVLFVFQWVVRGI